MVTVAFFATDAASLGDTRIESSALASLGIAAAWNLTLVDSFGNSINHEPQPDAIQTSADSTIPMPQAVINRGRHGHHPSHRSLLVFSGIRELLALVPDRDNYIRGIFGVYGVPDFEHFGLYNHQAAVRPTRPRPHVNENSAEPRDMRYIDRLSRFTSRIQLGPHRRRRTPQIASGIGGDPFVRIPPASRVH
jgi:hypothetical protein